MDDRVVDIELTAGQGSRFTDLQAAMCDKRESNILYELIE